MALTRLLPPPLRRAIRGLLGPRVVPTDELPPERSPGALALVRREADLPPARSRLLSGARSPAFCQGRDFPPWRLGPPSAGGRGGAL